jgi:hypothetical protein
MLVVSYLAGCCFVHIRLSGSGMRQAFREYCGGPRKPWGLPLPKLPQKPFGQDKWRVQASPLLESVDLIAIRIVLLHLL